MTRCLCKHQDTYIILKSFKNYIINYKKSKWILYIWYSSFYSVFFFFSVLFFVSWMTLSSYDVFNPFQTRLYVNIKNKNIDIKWKENISLTDNILQIFKKFIILSVLLIFIHIEISA